MLDARADEIIKQGDKLFERSSLLTLWQAIAENFYPIRADFTTKIHPGDDLTAHLSASFPILAHRDMSNNFAFMLRQRGTQWARIRTGREDLDEGRPREWLEWATALQFRAMYDRKAQFVRATKEGDNDWGAFGQCVIYIDTNRDGDTLLFRNYHLRDVAWAENAEGVIDTVHRRWKPTARDMVFDFGNKVHPSVKKEAESPKGDPFRTFPVRHAMVPTARVGDVPAAERGFPFRSYFIDVENHHVMEEQPSRLLKYVIPRWQTVSGSPYAYSPAVIAALPDARMIQAMTYSLLDATEKAVQPPMIGQANMVKSDIELWSGGFTWVDAEYDERLGEALRPVELDFRGLPAGVQAAQNAQGMIAEAFFLNKLALPPATRDMTAFETSQRIQEYIRQALPLFEPMEVEYNGQLMEMIFNTLMLGNAFNGREMPAELSGASVEFKFTSPLQQNEERKAAQTYVEANELLAQAAALDPGLGDILKGRDALRDALKGVGAPETWLNDDDEMDELAAQRAQAAQATQLMDTLERGGQVAEQVGRGAAALSDVNA